MNEIIQTDALTGFKNLPDESIDCIMTSPPYWALRDYGIKGQLGLEKTFEEYITKLCDIFEEAKRCLKKTGTCWVNLGDTYNANYRGGGIENASKTQKGNRGTIDFMGGTKPKESPLPSKCLTLIPFRFAIEMINRGWILRNVIIWYKKNCMPSSVKDRFTVDFEYLFFFVKNKKYWFETQYEAMSDSIEKSVKQIILDKDKEREHKKTSISKYYKNTKTEEEIRKELSKGRNKRTVWQINPKPFSEAHFAVYPEKLCITPIKAGCPEFICTKCGKAKKQINYIKKNNDAFNIRVRDVKKGRIKHSDRIASKEEIVNYEEKEYSPSFDYVISEGCNCNAPFIGGVVCDPFAGSGTTLKVAKDLNRQFIGFEINPEYIKIAEERLNGFKRKDWESKKNHKTLLELVGE